MKIVVSAGEQLLQKMLARFGFDVLIAQDGKEALKYFLTQDQPKIGILNWELGGLPAAEICKLVRDEQIEHYVYIILLTNKSQKDELLGAFEQGADDYLVKPFDGYELRAKLAVARRILDLQDRLISMREELRAQATHDSLTELWNRKETLNALSREIERADREKKPCGLIIADVDHFKEINDSYGHLAGDEVLKEIACRLKRGTRPYDIVGRYGGEEFLIIAPGCDAATTMKRAEALRTEISIAPMRTSEGNFPVTLSLGAAAIAPDMDKSAKSILRLADEALYRAKRGGRNRVELANLVLA
jgi:diguanylate cyclase (GGDEF)-like protein